MTVIKKCPFCGEIPEIEQINNLVKFKTNCKDWCILYDKEDYYEGDNSFNILLFEWNTRIE